MLGKGFCIQNLAIFLSIIWEAGFQQTVSPKTIFPKSYFHSRQQGEHCHIWRILAFRKKVVLLPKHPPPHTHTTELNPPRIFQKCIPLPANLSGQEGPSSCKHQSPRTSQGSVGKEEIGHYNVREQYCHLRQYGGGTTEKRDLGDALWIN